MDTEQKNIGTNNTNNNNSNNSLYCTININGNNEEIDIISVLKSLSNNFEDEDRIINSSLAKKVLVNKTHHEEKYKTDKIITSLLQLGIPLMAAYEIAEDTIHRIKCFINKSKKDNNNQKPILTTKDIRKMVSLSIQQMDLERYSYSDIESWNNKYIRRYGHNNQRVKVYYPGCIRTDYISYEFIRNNLLADVVNDITKGRIQYTEIPTRYTNEISKEILDFVNNCDLYNINYDTLKSMIKEIAIQPPHPWLVNKETRQSVIEYDIECLENNIKKIKSAFTNDEPTPQPAKIEILHHASALILEKYDYFLGCYDLSSFYLLVGIINELINKQNWDLTIENSKISNIISDLSFSNISIKRFVECLNQISHFLSEHKINNTEFDKYLLEFGEYALRFIELGNNDDVGEFLNTSWKETPNDKVIYNLKLLLYSIYPIKNWNLNTKENYFWLKYYNTSSNIIENLKNQFFVIYNDETISDWSFLSNLSTAKAINLCNLIIVISEDEECAINSCNYINKHLIDNKLAQSYVVIWLDKNHLDLLYNSKNKMKDFDKIIDEQLSVDE